MIGPVLISLGGNMEISTVTHAEVTTHNTHILIDTRHNSSHPDTLLYWTFYFLLIHHSELSKMDSAEDLRNYEGFK